MLTLKQNEIIIDGVKYVPVVPGVCTCCDGCAFNFLESLDHYCDWMACVPEKRDDKRDVIWVKEEE